MIKTNQPLEQYGLGNVDCDRCENTGYLVREDEDGVRWARECSCMNLRRELRQLNRRKAARLVITVEVEP